MDVNRFASEKLIKIQGLDERERTTGRFRKVAVAKNI